MLRLRLSRRHIGSGRADKRPREKGDVLRLAVRGRQQEERSRVRDSRLIASELGLNPNLDLNLSLGLPKGARISD